MSKTRIFISDLHLSSHHANLTHLFTCFIEQHAILADELYILGDLFDAWIGDDNLNAFNKKIASLIHSLSEKKIKVYFMHGNRDFLLGKKYGELCHMHLLPDPYVIQTEEDKLLLTHGDLFCTNDIAYQNYRKKIQQPNTIKLILKLPLFVRKVLAWSMRKKSKHETKQLTPESMTKLDVNIPDLLAYCDKQSITKIIHGHTHLPGIDLFKQQSNKNDLARYVLSDWHKTGHYLILKAGQAPQHCYFSETNTIYT